MFNEPKAGDSDARAPLSVAIQFTPCDNVHLPTPTTQRTSLHLQLVAALAKNLPVLPIALAKNAVVRRRTPRVPACWTVLL
jgi:hypothetical protein